MGSPFDAAAFAAEQTIDGVFSERIRVNPQAVGEYTTADDPERESFDCAAVVTLESSVARPRGAWRDDPTLAPGVAADGIKISVRAENLIGRTIVQNDQIILIDRPNESPLTALRIERDSVGRVTLICARMP